MSARYEFKVGPANRNSDYADPVTVYADSYHQAKTKAIEFRGYAYNDSKVWLIRIEEVPGRAEGAGELPAPTPQ